MHSRNTRSASKFGRKASFDPRTDGVVRLETLRLRERLRRYYTGEGREALILIELPKGTHVPVFQARAIPEPAQTRRWWRAKPVAALILLAASAEAVFLVERHVHPSKSPEAAIAVLPFLNLTGDSDDDYFEDGLADDLAANQRRGRPPSVGEELHYRAQRRGFDGR